MNEELKIVVIGIIMILGIGLVLFIPAYFSDKTACLKSYSDYNPQYTFWTGCRINYNGKLTPVDMVKNINLN